MSYIAYDLHDCTLHDYHTLRTFVAVRQEHDEPALSHPLGLSGAEELIDDALGGVREVPKLGLPEHQGIRVGQ